MADRRPGGVRLSRGVTLERRSHLAPMASYARGYRTTALVVVALCVAMRAADWWRAAAHGVWPAASQDTYLYYYPNIAYLQSSISQGFGVLWNGLQNCGQPAYGNGQIPALYPTTGLFLVLHHPVALVLTTIVHHCIGPLGVIVLARGFRLHPIAACTAAIALLTGDRTAQLAGWQPTGFIAFMWMPWALAGVERALRRPGFASAVLLGAVLTLQLLAGSPQLSLFTYEALALRCLWELATRWRPRARAGVLTFAAGAVMPLGLAAAMLLPAIELNRVSIRGARLSSADLLGGALTPTWAEFRRRLTVPLSDSAICQPWFLGLAALGACARFRRRVAAFYLLAAGLFLALSFDGPLFALYRALPFGELFRYPARFRNVTAVLLSIAVAFGMQAFLAAWRQRGWRPWAALSAPLLGLGLFGWLAQNVPGGFALGYTSGLVAIGLGGTASRRRPAAPRRRRWRNAVAGWTAVTPVLLLAIILARNAVPPSDVRSGVGTLFARARELTALASEMSLADRAYLFRDARPGRNDDWSVAAKSSSLFGVRGVSDYEPQVSQRFANLMLRLRGATRYQGFAQFEFLPEAPRNRPILNLLAARFVVGNVDPPVARDGSAPVLREIHRDGHFVVFENPAALPRAFYVPSVEVVPAPAAILDRLAAPDHDPRRVALLERPPPGGFLGTPTGSGRATIDADRGEELRIAVEADAPGFLFVSDQDYPGWSATVNGVQTPILRANYAFRLVRVPAGTSHVVFRYRPLPVRLGAAVSIATFLALVGVAAYRYIVRRRRAR